MSLIISATTLASRIERQSATAGAGIRRFASNGVIPRANADPDAPTFWDGLARFGATLLSAMQWQPPWLNINISQIWSTAVQAYHFVWNFNINSTDKELDAQIKQAEIAIAGARGRLRGVTAGFLVCGILPTAALAVFNEPLALYTLKEVGEEAAEEITSAAAALMQLTTQAKIQKAFNTFFKNHRDLVRAGILGFAKGAQFFGVPIDDQAIAKANKQRNEPWSLASAMDESIERIGDPVKKAETEEFWEEFGEACIEAGYVVASSIDSWILQQRTEQKNSEQAGNEDVIIINPSGSISSAISDTDD